ncbi:MAG: PAS domain-containing protein [Alphaproteobacteria bacterium]|nr:PAS domain-containing protein [Alphaproteobacteria bacterium]MBU0797231.1 PAS domain-containing protein [Alphaproteobacteria bacterium]MBU0888981.1 PAS domain-containing protein [Alphaproteobacteria bacterium]MBU1814001.1 PAS domain-containing protein [Alphaproteobacteria bacterium]
MAASLFRAVFGRSDEPAALVSVSEDRRFILRLINTACAVRFGIAEQASDSRPLSVMLRSEDTALLRGLLDELVVEVPRVVTIRDTGGLPATLMITAFASPEGTAGRYYLLRFPRSASQAARFDPLRATELMPDGLLNAIPTPVFYKDREGRFVDCNTAYEIHLGLTREEIIGLTAVELGPIGQLPEHRETDRRILGGKEPLAIYEVRERGPDGTWRDIMVQKSAYHDSRGAVAGLIGTIFHLTEQKRKERELQHAKEMAELASRAKSDFLAKMSHELRTPLNAIIGFAEVMETQMFGALGNPRYPEYARHIRESGAFLLHIINDILDTAKIEAGKYELNESAFDLGALIDDCLQLLRGRAEQHCIALVSDMAPNLPQLWADQRALKQILLNLLSNAVKFTRDGGRVTVQAGRDQDGLTLSVSDTGIGIPAEQIARVVVPFEQVQGGSMHAPDGTGLGLAVAKSLVDLHGGRLKITSVVDIGTTVSVFLPAKCILPSGSCAINDAG